MRSCNNIKENLMTKLIPKQTAPAVTQSLGLAARALARLEAEAATVHASETACRQAQGESHERWLQLVSTKEHGFSAVIRHGKTIVEISGNDFAVRQTG
jgi:hypothetical protein